MAHQTKMKHRVGEIFNMQHKIHTLNALNSLAIFKMFALFVSALFIFTLLTPTFATTYTSLTIEEILEKTDIAFHGTVTEVVVELRTDQEAIDEASSIWTKVTFDVSTNLKGDLAESHSLYFYGGVLEEKSIQVEAMPEFRVDEEVIIFAYDAVYYSPLVGFSQGLFRLDEGGWKNEADKWLGLARGDFVFVDSAFEGTEVVLTVLEEIFASTEGITTEGEGN